MADSRRECRRVSFQSHLSRFVVGVEKWRCTVAGINFVVGDSLCPVIWVDSLVEYFDDPGSGLGNVSQRLLDTDCNGKN